MSRLGLYALLMFLYLSSTGCSLVKGGPKPPIDVEKVTSRITEKLENFDDAQITDAANRNKSINQALALIDLQYSEFINNAGIHQRFKDMAVDFVAMSLNLAGTAVGGASAKTLLAALSAGVTGTNIAFDKNFIYESTLPALIMQMNADRAEKYRLIVSGMANPNLDGAGGYSWAQAVRDLIDYYNAGTLQSAISSIKKNAGNKQVLEEKRTEAILMPKKATKDDIAVKTEITQSLKNINDSNLKQVKAILEPLSNALNHLPSCGNLVQSDNDTVGVKEVKQALIECIRDVSTETGRSYADDFAEITKEFIDAGIMTAE